MKAVRTVLLGLLVTCAGSVYGTAKGNSTAACAFALGLGLELTTERRERIVDVRLLDAASQSVAQLEARIDGEDERTLFVTTTEGADDDDRRLEALLLGALAEAPRATVVDVYLTAADFRAAVVPLLNQDLPPSRGLRRTKRYEVLKRLGFAEAASFRFETIGEDGENELQVRLVVGRGLDFDVNPDGPTRLQ